MTPRKLNVLITTFSYGGNGGIASEVPDVRDWLIWNIPKIEHDERCHLIYPRPQRKVLDIADTPITMNRNQAVVAARELNADVLLMIDSDIAADDRLGQPDAKPFWDEAFEFMYSRWDRGPHVVGAPYCGPGPENVYVFKWSNQFSGDSDGDFQLIAYERLEAAAMAGIQPCAALPTGLILYDTRIFRLAEPSRLSRSAILDQFKAGEIDKREALRLLEPGWFAYEYTDQQAYQKASTEDVMATRDMSVLGEMLLGYNPVHCAWDSWAGHWKPKRVGKPQILSPNEMGERYKEAAGRPPRHVRQIFQQSKIADELDWSTATRVEPPENPPWGKYHRVIAGQKVTSWGFQTSEEDLAVLGELVARVVRRFGHLRAVEIGSWVGESALAMVEACQQLGCGDCTIWCVDPWTGALSDSTAEIVEEFGGPDALYKQFLENVAPYRCLEIAKISETGSPHRIIACRRTSEEAVAVFRLAAGLIFIDGDHAELAVEKDLALWWPFVQPGGIICGHDYADPDHPGVTVAVGKFFAAEGREIHHPPDSRIWWVEKPEKPQDPEKPEE